MGYFVNFVTLKNIPRIEDKFYSEIEMLADMLNIFNLVFTVGFIVILLKKNFLGCLPVRLSPLFIFGRKKLNK